MPLRSPPDGQQRYSLSSALGRSTLSVRVIRPTLTLPWHRKGKAREEVMSTNITVKGRQMAYMRVNSKGSSD